MPSRIVTISAILSLLASIIFSIVGYAIGDVPIGVYFAILTIALTSILLIFYVEFHHLISSLAQLISAGSYKARSLQQILANCKGRRAVLYLNSVRLLVELATAKSFARVPLELLDVYVSPGAGDADELTSESEDNLGSRFHSVSLTPAQFPFNLLLAPIDGDKAIAFLASAWSLDFSDSWISGPDTQGHSVIADILNDEIKRPSIPIQRLKSVRWLLRQYAVFSELTKNRSNDLATGKINSTSPEEIYAHQIALSRGAKSILALDMTDVDEWFDAKGLGKCLEENILSSRGGDADIRRIFICRSRAFMASTPAYRRALAAVIKSHIDNGLGAGLVYQEDIKNPSVIHDAVVYDRNVVWVETLPTARFSGEGYFSTDKALIEQHCATFERFWLGDFTRSPSEEALTFLRECADETS